MKRGGTLACSQSKKRAFLRVLKGRGEGNSQTHPPFGEWQYAQCSLMGKTRDMRQFTYGNPDLRWSKKTGGGNGTDVVKSLCTFLVTQTRNIYCTPV